MDHSSFLSLPFLHRMIAHLNGVNPPDASRLQAGLWVFSASLDCQVLWIHFLLSFLIFLFNIFLKKLFCLPTSFPSREVGWSQDGGGE